MTLDEAILIAGREVAAASPNLTVDRFHQTVKSLVVTTFSNDIYIPVTVEQWRNQLNREFPIVITMGTADSFGERCQLAKED